MTREPQSDAELWKLAAESSFEVVTTALQGLVAEPVDIHTILKESRMATCALQELENRKLGHAPKKLSE